VFRKFIGAQNKLGHLLQALPSNTDPTYVLTGANSVMIWLLNSLEEKISGSILFLTTAKEMWDTLKVMYDNEKNPSRVFDIFELLFELKYGDRSVPEFYGELKGLIDESEIHQPVVTDAANSVDIAKILQC